ncbi:sugar phosphate isomerase/epimerase family protein [Granulosicoccus sp. 3-233]|uniref:sugar phosphate isomerase/epimerase family protein n=1 Tax=Granulosicoccus sp. 3-233 TaxID=3417969 RepID=UPI003D34BE60
MKLGINLLCTSGFIDTPHVEVFELAKSAGFDGVEIPVMSGTPEHYARLSRFLDQLGLERTSTMIIPDPDRDPGSADPAIRQRGIDHLNWAIDCNEALGSTSIGGPFHAPIGHFPGRGPTEDELQRCAEVHHDMAQRAFSLGIQLSLEPLNRFETHFLNTMEQAVAYAERVDHPNFKIMYDTFHAHIEEQDPLAAAHAIRDHLGVLHVSENDRGIPGRGQVDFASLFRTLKQDGFDNWIVVEAFGNALPELSAATRVWRPLFPDLHTLFHESAELVRSTWTEVKPNK